MDDEDRRSRLDHAQGGRVIGFVQADEAQAASRPRLQFLDRGLAGGEADARPAAGQAGHGADGRGGAAEALQETQEGARTDALGARQPDPVDALGIAQGRENRCHAFWPMRPSVPDIRRPMLARCIHQSATARIRNTSAGRGWPRRSSARGLSRLATSAEAEE